MTYFNFTKITPAAPNDPLVNEQTQLNDNWVHADEQLTPYVTEPTPATMPGALAGQEWIYQDRLAVWDGATLITPQDIKGAWGAWNQLFLDAPVNYRDGFIPFWRVNTLLRMVELGGGVIYGATAAWPASFTDISGTTTDPGVIPDTYQPVGGRVYQVAACSQPTDDLGTAALISIDKHASLATVHLRARFQGGSGGGNYIQLDSVRWFY